MEDAPGEIWAGCGPPVCSGGPLCTRPPTQQLFRPVRWGFHVTDEVICHRCVNPTSRLLPTPTSDWLTPSLDDLGHSKSHLITKDTFVTLDTGKSPGVLGALCQTRGRRPNTRFLLQSTAPHMHSRRPSHALLPSFNQQRLRKCPPIIQPVLGAAVRRTPGLALRK